MEHLLLKKTADGSHTIYHRGLDEHYHSTHGAIRESMHVFIRQGFDEIADKKISKHPENPIHILEIGMGTGLNVLLTFLNSPDRKIDYTAVEPYPLDIETVVMLNYPELLAIGAQKEVFQLIHEADPGINLNFSDNFCFRKLQVTVEQLRVETSFHLIYFDAFAPGVQPGIWTADIFRKLYQALEKNGCLVTYCAKGEVKRNLKAVGFIVESLPGPPGKREMTRAWKEKE